MNVIKMREIADSLLDAGKYEDAYYVYDEIYKQFWLVLGLAHNGLTEFSQSYLGYGYKTNFEFRNIYTLKAMETVCKKWLELDLIQTLNEFTFTIYGHLQSICYSPVLIKDQFSDAIFNEFLILHSLILNSENDDWIKSIFKIATPQLDGNLLKKIRMNLSEENLKRSLIENAAKIKTTDWKNVNITFLDYLFNSGDNSSVLYNSVFKVVGYHFNKKGRRSSSSKEKNDKGNGSSGQYERYEKYEKYEHYERYEKHYYKKDKEFDPAGATEFEKAKFYGNLLGLTGKVTKSQIRKNYLELIAKYHPDKVFDLGEELKILAEKKTKQLNMAYEWMKKEHDL